MNNVKEKLLMILEGTYINEAEVISFSARSKQRQYEQEFKDVNLQVHKVTEEYKAIIMDLELKKRGGLLTNDEYIEKVMAHQPKQRLMHDLNHKLGDIKTHLELIAQGKGNY